MTFPRSTPKDRAGIECASTHRGVRSTRTGVSEEPVEDYLIAVWPQEPADSVVIRSSKMIDEALLANADTTPDDISHATSEPDDAAERDRRADVRARLLRSLQDD
ncbi:hypothetical protein Srufu_076850 [Streptomyces libani subsp. rufus]|nr:hypothetical protein Srufu_076850 [Streptomyces libani subsp. rufus]